MSTTEAILLFLSSLALTIVASVVLSRRLKQVGTSLQMSQSLLGIVAALGSDAPEISSAITALRGGEHDLGLGIVLGSNIFNLAALLGVGALASGRVKVARPTLLLNGAVALSILAVTMLQLYRILPAAWGLGLTLAIFLPYVVAVSISPERLTHFASRFGVGLAVLETVTDADKDATESEMAPQPSYADSLGIIPALVSIVLASIGMVHSAVLLGQRWHIPGAVTGTIILATLTGIPNIVTSVLLAMRGRGSAVLSEALNSNTLNLVAGVAVPALLLGLVPLSSGAALAVWWLAGMTVLALALSWLRGGLGRVGGAVLVAVYVAFALLTVLRPWA